MAGMDPEALDELCEGLRSFLRVEVVGRHESLPAAHHDLYDATGRYRPAILRAMREVRQASATAGYFTALAPEEVGGAGRASNRNNLEFAKARLLTAEPVGVASDGTGPILRREHHAEAITKCAGTAPGA